MIEYAKVYLFYRKAIVRMVRLLILFLLFLILANQHAHSGSVKIPLLVFNLVVIFEIFFHFKISRVSPKLLAAKNNGKDIYQSFTMQALLPFLIADKTSTIIG